MCDRLEQGHEEERVFGKAYSASAAHANFSPCWCETQLVEVTVDLHRILLARACLYPFMHYELLVLAQQ
jgi:hypothetical protein